MLAIGASLRDLRDFIAAKRRKREPLRWSAKGAAAATYIPREARGFANFREALRLSSDWSQAAEKIDALATALARRHSCDLPLPRKVIQNSDRSITLFWAQLTVRAFPDQLTAMIGGSSGEPVRGITSDILDMLAFQAKIH